MSRIEPILQTPLVDLQGLTRPEPFSGKDEDWSGWRFKFESLCILMDGTLARACKHATRRGRQKRVS